VINYPTYDKELYALVQSVKKWKHYLFGKETIVHTDHQPLQYLQSQTKVQQARHFKWMGFLQQFLLVISIRREFISKSLIRFQGLLLVLQLFLSIVLSCMKVMLSNMLWILILKKYMKLCVILTMLRIVKNIFEHFEQIIQMTHWKLD
jgi:hypothetical protein